LFLFFTSLIVILHLNGAPAIYILHWFCSPETSTYVRSRTNPHNFCAMLNDSQDSWVKQMEL